MRKGAALSSAAPRCHHFHACTHAIKDPSRGQLKFNIQYKQMYDFNLLMFEFLRLLIDLGQDIFRLESGHLHHDLNFSFLWKL